ncbi:glycerol-3-phosphate acyltransferase [Paenibacillus kobensis]|uniref:glycerol-3-phosphate acyltransferase n=1 Tax=Paenibacillus kobensis TaxID=59841 RepID=UPI000FDBE9CD|nr:glycerol-3-phosphate acyltransferase [Paenibacillus kobensis]
MEQWWAYPLIAVTSYLIGNFSAAIFLSKRFIRQDIRQLGSRNPGTTNMTRAFGLKYGAVTLLLDFAKALVCVIASKLVMIEAAGSEAGMLAGYLAGLAVIIGHNYPVLQRFKGGKGFASGIGVFVVLNPLFTLIVLLAGLLFLVIVDRMSVFAIAFFAVQTIGYTVSYDYWWTQLFVWTYLLLAVVAHWPNIIRLIRKEENLLGIRQRLFNKLGLGNR